MIHQQNFIKKIKKYYKKKLVKDIKIFLKKGKKKSNNMVGNVTNVSQKVKNKSMPSREKISENERKRFTMITTKYFHLKNFASL